MMPEGLVKISSGLYESILPLVKTRMLAPFKPSTFIPVLTCTLSMPLQRSSRKSRSATSRQRRSACSLRSSRRGEMRGAN